MLRGAMANNNLGKVFLSFIKAITAVITFNYFYSTQNLDVLRYDFQSY